MAKQLRPERDPPLAGAPPGTCVFCGCTNGKACPGGCWWIDDNDRRVCSTCAVELADVVADAVADSIRGDGEGDGPDGLAMVILDYLTGEGP